jgi:FtsZ-interacting cell division protein ZipA
MLILLADISPVAYLFHPVVLIAGLFVTVAAVLAGLWLSRRMKSKDRNPAEKP